MDGKAIGNRHIKVANVVPRSFEKKSPTVGGSEDLDTSLSLHVSEEADTVPRARTVRDAVTPLAHMSYNDQLEHKKNSLAQTLKRLVREPTYNSCFVFIVVNTCFLLPFSVYVDKYFGIFHVDSKCT